MSPIRFIPIPYDEATDCDLARAVYSLVSSQYNATRKGQPRELVPSAEWLADNVSRLEADLYATLAFIGQMYNGGIEQALGNSGDYAPTTCDALDRLGHFETANALREIVRVWCPDGRVPCDNDARWENLSRLKRLVATGGVSCEDVYTQIETIDSPAGQTLYDQFGAMIRARPAEFSSDRLAPHLKKMEY